MQAYNIRKRNRRTGKGWKWLTARGWRVRRAGALVIPADEIRSKVSELLTGTIEPGVWFEWVEVEER